MYDADARAAEADGVVMGTRASHPSSRLTSSVTDPSRHLVHRRRRVRLPRAPQAARPQDRRRRELDAQVRSPAPPTALAPLTRTSRSPFHDQLNNNGLWGQLYDGRAITGPIHDKFLGGSSLEECRKSLKEDYSAEESTKIVNTWA